MRHRHFQRVTPECTCIDKEIGLFASRVKVVDVLDPDCNEWEHRVLAAGAHEMPW